MRNGIFIMGSLMVCLATMAGAQICEDNYAWCSQFSLTDCASSPPLEIYCPFTCGTCEDACRVNNGGCNQICSSEAGQAVCGCEKGFGLSSDGKTCVDLCEINNGGCSDLCSISMHGDVVCACSKGYRLDRDRKTCLDIDECTEGPNPCILPFSDVCINEIGSYSCQQQSCEKPEGGVMNYYKSKECCQVRNGTCGITASIRKHLSPSTPEPRILQGIAASISAWPWMVQLSHAKQHICGGTLLTDRFVLTSKSCLGDLQATEIMAHMGHVRNAFLKFLDSSRRVDRKVIRAIVHPADNVALLELAEPVAFDDTVNQICLPCGEQPQEGDKCWATGFGATENVLNAPPSRLLQEVDLPIANMDNCVRSYAEEFARFLPTSVDSASMLCAGYENGGKDTCNGDGGGPLMCQRKDSCEWYVAGITFFGKGCGRAGYYGVYTKVAHVEQWIRAALGERAADLCTRDYSPCKNLQNQRTDCKSIGDICTSPFANQCKLTCCQRGIEPVQACFDAPGTENVCNILKDQCNNRDFLGYSFMEDYCKKTCNFC
ncbi:serine protease 55-like [Clavelina lepadiformis]|uniref:serine protease 55-like n=1 Tax=Clavelina lepadiformis TaxID=159417 RepID=UPI0040410C24